MIFFSHLAKGAGSSKEITAYSQLQKKNVCVKYYLNRVSSRNFILGGKLANHMAIWPQQWEGRFHNYNYWQYLGGGGGEVGSV